MLGRPDARGRRGHCRARYRRLVSSGTCAALALAGSLVAVPIGAAGATAPAGTRGPAPLRWHSCDARFECATLRVPLSYQHPSGPTIGLALIRLPATRSGPVRDLVLNPGGPGASGVDFLRQAWRAFPAAIRSRFTLVSFDPRGVGRSEPVRCLTPSGMRTWISLDPAPTSAAAIARSLTATKAYDAACEARTASSLLANVSTLDEAADMDRLRGALGQPKLDYIGQSYGTYLGALYAQLYPSRVGAMVLDGAFDPALSTVQLERQQAVGFENDLHDFFAWCPTDPACAGELPHGARPAYATLMARLSAGGIRGRLDPALGGDRTVTLGMAELGVIAALYSKSTWPDLARAISSALHGDAGLLGAMALQYAGFGPDGSLSNISDANTAISCVDRSSPRTAAQYEQLAAQLAAVAPDFGPAEAWSSLPCAFWPVAPAGQPQPIRAPGAPPILVIGSTRDPATPYVWARALATQLSRGVLLTRSGDGHTSYFVSSCIQGWTDGYLLTLATPPAATVCAS